MSAFFLTIATIAIYWAYSQYQKDRVRDLLYLKASRKNRKICDQLEPLLKRYYRGRTSPANNKQLVRLLRRRLHYHFELVQCYPNISNDHYVSDQLRLIRELEGEAGTGQKRTSPRS